MSIIVHLVVVGQNPVDNEYSIALMEDEAKLHTIQGKINKDPDYTVCKFAEQIIDAPLDWYAIRKQTFVTSEQYIHLVYVATVPKNIKLKKGAKWYSISALSSLEFACDSEKDIIIEGIKL